MDPQPTKLGLFTCIFHSHSILLKIILSVTYLIKVSLELIIEDAPDELVIPTSVNYAGSHQCE